ncbi:MAG: DUF5106 domain-containing protein [Muribaculaceae bacterium]|nr:DUF5106 domain-containing protein [Muribaculaceae bacterium]
MPKILYKLHCYRLLKVYLTFISVCFVMLVTPWRTYAQDLLVDVPVPPAEITKLDERCNYIIDNFWKHFNFKSAFSSHDKMEATLGQFIAVAPYATADTVYAAVDNLIKGVEKADAKNLVPLAQMVERWCGTDTAEYASEEFMLPFAQAVANSKKIKGPEKEYYSAMAQRLGNSRTGVKPADFTFTTPDGTTERFSDVTQPTVLLFFYDPNDFQSRLARTRLGNDYVVKTLTQHDLLKVVAIYPGEPDETWQADIDGISDQWIIGAAPGIDKWFTIKGYPQMYFLDEDRVITDKNFSTDAIIQYFGQFMQPRK